MTKQALIIIDMQVGSFTPMTIRHDAEGLVGRLNSLADRVRGAGGQVIYIRHDGTEGDPHHPSQPGWQILPELDVRAEDRIVAKTACDSFLGTELASVLQAAGINDLIITGCASEFCVDTSIRSALGRGYNVTAPSDGHTTANRSYLDAEKIIDHHNAVWADFIAPGGAAKVCACSDISL